MEVRPFTAEELNNNARMLERRLVKVYADCAIRKEVKFDALHAKRRATLLAKEV